MRVWILGGRLSVWKRLVKVLAAGVRLYLWIVGKGRLKTLGTPMQGCARCRVGGDSGFWGERGEFWGVGGGVGEEWSFVPAHTCTNANYII